LRLIGVIGLLLVLAFALVQLAGCSAAKQYPGSISCKGKATLSANGGGTMIGSGEGSVMFDCGPDGAFISQGPPLHLDAPAPAP